ncbi:hypothetical protein EYZ11_004882 [Aspergillus tanneri]|uniref:Uncharacterized protein n=1 Tax=Aspergillus tanneri TaxID=1220188 RepID=A0A4S3JJX0_9EURO|nr:uncharacterized protein ATNIH1004_000525 [Aspergillus tanneri]KAA8651634.1 hypothetical protein ATNIH1004_000525 [Aspergillus tanneri]THC95620.1 hypothetical protein EYZ11_004882 [Aspergillus tanneri]
MTDPLSIAGTAIGVISFGLQVRQEITTYCRAWRGTYQEIQDVANKADGLEAPLQTLREIIKDMKVTDPDIANDLREKLGTLREGIQRVHASIEKWKPDRDPDGFADKIRAQAKRAVYPFRKDVLRDLARELDGIQVGLHTTLHVFSAQNTRLIPSLMVMQTKLLREVQEMHLELQHTSKASPPPPELLQSWCKQSEIVVPGHQSQQTKKYSYHSRLLGLTIAASFSLTRGAGGFSIAPTLTFQVPMSPNSPGFRTLYLYGFMGKSQPPAQFVDNTIELLKYLFVERVVSPSDMTVNGGSLLDAACFAFYSCSSWHANAYAEFSRLFMFLLNNGALPDTSHTRARTGLDSFVGAGALGEEEFQLLSLLIQRGGFLTIEAVFGSSLSKANVRRVLSENEEAVAIPDIAKFIIEESAEDLRNVLRSGEASANDCIGSTTPVRLAVGWSKGLQILVEAGADLNMKLNDLSPLGIAIRGGHYQSAKVLLQAGCSLSLDDICRNESVDDPDDMSSLLISELASRRKRLLKLAQAHMSPEQLLQIGVGNDSSVPDASASRMYAALVAQGARVDPSLKVSGPPCSVYHSIYMRTRTLDLLYKAGFDNVELCDSLGRTPLMIIDKRTAFAQRRARWLIRKGADPNRIAPGTSATVFHLLGTCLPSTLYPEVLQPFILNFQTYDSERKHENPLQFFDFIFQAPNRDKCVCACSPGGCTPFSVAVRRLLQNPPRYYQRGGANRFPDHLDFFISRTDRSEEVDRAVIRLMTFDALDLKHTCCRRSDSMTRDDTIVYLEEVEVDEIRDEEQLLLEDFERLCTELTAEHVELCLPIMEFLQVPWHKRILEYLSHLDPYDEEHVRETRGIGLNIEIGERVPDRVSLLVGSIG